MPQPEAPDQTPPAPHLTVVDGAGQSPHFTEGVAVELRRIDAVSIAKSERPLYETMTHLLGLVGLLPEDEAEHDALQLRLDALTREAESQQWIRSAHAQSYAPDVLLQAQKATEEYDDAPLLDVVMQVRREYPNPRNQRLEYMARQLIQAEIAEAE